MKKIKEIKVIDLTEFSYTEQVDEELMYQTFLNYKINGGDLDSLIYFNPNDNLLNLKEFCEKRGLENGVLKKLLKTGAMNSFCDFIYDEQSGQIFESKKFGITWMRDNWEKPEYQDTIKQAMDNLIEKLPNDYNKINGFNTYTQYDNKFSEHKHPLLFIFEMFSSEYLLLSLLEKKPEYKNYFNKKINFHYKSNKETEGISVVERILANRNNYYKRSNLAAIFYEKGIGHEYFHAPENIKELQDLIGSAVANNNLSCMDIIVKNVNLLELQKSNMAHDLYLSKAKTKEMAELLIKNGSPDITYVKYNNNNEMCQQCAILGEYQKNFEPFKVVIDKYPEKYKEIFENNLHSVLSLSNTLSTKYAIDKFNLDISKEDVLFWADFKFFREEDEKIYQYIKERGANFDYCDKFIEKVVKNREDGLKKLRRLNKEKIIDSKSPAIVHEVLKNKPTKTFLSYYDKLTEDDLNKEDSLKRIAWWGCQTDNEFSFVKFRAKKLQMENSEGKTFIHYLLENQLKTINYAKMSDKKIIENLATHYTKGEDLKKIDWNYEDKNGNNLLHLIFTNKQYYKEEIGNDFLKTLLNKNLITKEEINLLLDKKNKDNIKPIALLENAFENKALSTKAQRGLEDFYRLMGNELNLMIEIKEGLTLGEFIFEKVQDDTMKKELHMNLLNQMLPNKEGVKKKNKL